VGLVGEGEAMCIDWMSGYKAVPFVLSTVIAPLLYVLGQAMSVEPKPSTSLPEGD
jgi:hypothetical protein